MREKFIEWKPGARSLELVDQINLILQSYEEQGYCLTLRQLYHQLVSRDLILNNIRSYKSIGDVASQGRLAGLIDWRTRGPRSRSCDQFTLGQSCADPRSGGKKLLPRSVGRPTHACRGVV